MPKVWYPRHNLRERCDFILSCGCVLILLSITKLQLVLSAVPPCISWGWETQCQGMRQVSRILWTMLSNSGVFFLSSLTVQKSQESPLHGKLYQKGNETTPRASHVQGPHCTTGLALEQKKLGPIFIISMNGTTTHQAGNLELSLIPFIPSSSTSNLPANPFNFTSIMYVKSVFCSPSHFHTPVPGSVALVWIITSFLSPISTHFLLQSIICTVAGII